MGRAYSPAAYAATQAILTGMTLWAAAHDDEEDVCDATNEVSTARVEVSLTRSSDGVLSVSAFELDMPSSSDAVAIALWTDETAGEIAFADDLSTPQPFPSGGTLEIPSGVIQVPNMVP